MNAEKFYYYLCIISFVVDIKKVYSIFFSLFLFPPHQKFLINDGVLQCVESSQKFRLSIESKQIRNESERGTKMRRTKTWNHQKKNQPTFKNKPLEFSFISICSQLILNQLKVEWITFFLFIDSCRFCASTNFSTQGMANTAVIKISMPNCANYTWEH